MPNHESEPLLPAPVTHSHPLSSTATSPTTRSKLNARRMSTGPLSAPPSGGASSFGMSEKSRGKQRAREGEEAGDNDRGDSAGFRADSSSGKRRTTVGRHVTVIFSGDDGGGSEGNLDLWVEDGESVGAVKEQVSWGGTFSKRFRKGGCRRPVSSLFRHVLTCRYDICAPD